MRTEVIKADTIDAAVDRILNELATDTRRSGNRENVVYFDGWDGLGASAVLQAVAKRLAEPLTRPAGLEFEKIIHIDCSKWQSRRAMQREIAEQLKLPNRVMQMFDKQDEDDDFSGLDQGSRGEIAQVVREVYQTTRNRRFLVILHNGSPEVLDLFDFGIFLDRYANSKMLWTFQGRFRLDPKMIDNVKNTSTDVILSAERDVQDPKELWLYLVHHEAAQACCNKHGDGIIDPSIAAECVLYMLKQSWTGSHVIDYDWAIHTSNYWVCTEIIALTDLDKAWKVADVLQGEVRLLNCGIANWLSNGESTIMPSSHLARSAERMPYWIWISPATCGFVQSRSGVILDSMFEHSHRLSVLKLSCCTFSFSSPPFLCCHILRFLWLDHCQDLRSSDAEKKEEDEDTTRMWACFQSLWVLDMRYTDWDQILSAQTMDLMTQVRELNVMGAKNWDMSHLQGRLRNIRKLRVTKSTCCFSNNVFPEMESMELLEFSGNTIRQGMPSLSGAASNSNLKTVIIDGCDGLEVISLQGCKELSNLFFKGLFESVKELDLSGTKVKTLNLREVGAISLPERIILLGCEELHAILWPQDGQGWDGLLLIDTTSTPASADGSLGQQKEKKLKGGWQISLTDTRLLRSLSPVASYLTPIVHIDISSEAPIVQGTSSEQLVQVQHTGATVDSNYRDVLKHGPVTEMMMWDCPEMPVGSSSCFIEVIMRGGKGKELLEDAPSACTSALLLPDFVCEQVTSLHVYNNSSITSIPVPPSGSGWNFLFWCQVERCPKLHTVFTVPQGSSVDSFRRLKTFWASQLLTTCYIWDWTVFVTSHTFRRLKFLHLDYCPRLIHVLPIHKSSLSGLETLEIVYCSDLREVFPLSPELQDQDKIIQFPELRRIHLHELPTLQHICGRRMYAPNLETIKIRGCWSLWRLPAIGRDSKPPKVDCEKDWWDNLEWDGVEKYHHPSLYEPSDSKYYKAKLPRGSLLR
ncbi:uncharacterized protein LOC100828398 isoform X2 [Brachypodium distachyon]|uniref:uncharacterized protein LOC100828398 isoform X1 n=1 Tax=Brachypodium distachyon TaxID=15368 RepID=UPI000D0DA1E3|nr:uncharacterized protein LOC100828398 isoform X1 [Brachypodium distachyon]XP_024316829.1 uncharacterized protein LOC100828398 isoform X2 [Brachypodium distachyon]|eukprot:XP_024316828.1 uncharacterized protein LOC100828398 isoform X1 [Brachypodium distachyon]